MGCAMRSIHIRYWRKLERYERKEMNNLPPLEPLRPAYRMQCMTETQLEQMQAATLEILEKTGVKFPSEKCLKIFAEHGAQVDWQTQVVRLPGDLVRRALASVPRYFNMGARAAQY